MPAQPMITVHLGLQPTSAGIRGSRDRGTIISSAGLNRISLHSKEATTLPSSGRLASCCPLAGGELYSLSSPLRHFSPAFHGRRL
jgi:hypothetical protein